ncbi:MAG TPA: hypothetical protein VLD62_01465 [Acidimicrobiia bacterium]|nr:hypothetical protein [Acidimicrobiia bacterium]
MDLARRRIFIVPTRRDLDVAAAIGHWTGRHGEIFGATPEVGAYVQHQPSWADQERLGGIVCSEISFPDRETERRAFTCEYYETNVAPDEASFLERSDPYMPLIRSSEVIGDSAGDAEVLVFGWDGGGLPSGLAAEICELDREGPRGGPARLLMIRTSTGGRAQELAADLRGDIVFAARRVVIV